MLIYNIHRNTLFEPNWKGFDEQSRKITHFEKSAKNTFLVNSKKWKKGGKGSSKRNHPKVALTNCHHFVNSDPHAKIYENPT